MTAAPSEQPKPLEPPQSLQSGSPAAVPGPATVTVAATLWRLALGQPQLLAAHLFGYVDLVRDGAAQSLALLRWRVALWVACWSGLLVTAVLLGLAMMMWGSAAPGALARPWVLFAVPAVPLALSLLSLLAMAALTRRASAPPWGTLRTQAAADLAVLNAHGR